MRRRGYAQFGVATTGGQRTNAVANFEIRAAYIAADNLASNFESRQIRCAFGRRISPGTLQNIWSIDARCLNADEYLTRSWCRVWSLAKLKNFRCARLRDFNGFHQPMMQ